MEVLTQQRIFRSHYSVIVIDEVIVILVILDYLSDRDTDYYCLYIKLQLSAFTECRWVFHCPSVLRDFCRFSTFGFHKSTSVAVNSTKSILTITTPALTAPSNKMCLPTTLPSPECFADYRGAAKASGIRNKSNKRRLSFAPEISRVVATILPRHEYTAKEIESCWWSAREQAFFRVDSKEVALRVKKCGSSFITLLDDSYEAAHDLSFRLSESAIDDLLKDPSKHTSKLEAWTLIGQERRGLEKSISDLQRFERKTGARESRGMVLELVHMGISGDEIGNIYALHCRTSRIYARMMGNADRRSVSFL
jgi:hypothetical protein